MIATQAGWDWRISLTEAGLALGSLRNYDLPAPSVASFEEWQTAVTRSDGSQARHGYQSMSLLWNTLSESQLFRLRKFIADAQAGTGLLYLTVDREVGLTRDRDFVDISGFPHLPPTASSSPIVDRISGQAAHTDFTLTLNNVTIINFPSSYTT